MIRLDQMVRMMETTTLSRRVGFVAFNLQAPTRVFCLGLTALACFFFTDAGTHADTIYVGDLGASFANHKIVRFDSSGSGSVFADASSGVNNPYALALDSSGNLYASSGGNSIVKYDSSANASVFATNGAGALAFDVSGNLYGISGESTILKFDLSANASVFANLGSGHFLQRLAIDSTGNLYVGDAFPHVDKILKLNSSGISSVFATDVISPRGLAFDTSGNLYVAEAGRSRVLKIDPNGNKSLFASAGSEADLFDLAFDSSGNLYAVDFDGGFGNGKILKFDSNGNGSVFGSGLNIPLSIAIQVPEPATWSLLILGVGALLGNRRLRRRFMQS